MLTIPIPVNGVNGEIVEDGPVDELIVAGTVFGIFSHSSCHCRSLNDFDVDRIRPIKPRVFPPPQENPV